MERPWLRAAVRLGLLVDASREGFGELILFGVRCIGLVILKSRPWSWRLSAKTGCKCRWQGNIGDRPMFRAAQDLASVGRVPYLNDARGLGVPQRLSIPCSVSGTLPNSVRSAVNKCHGDRPPQAPPVSAAPFLARGAGDWRKRCGHGARCLRGWRTGEEYRPWSLRGGGIRGSQVRGRFGRRPEFRRIHGAML